MANPWGDRDWTTYYDAVAGKPPRDTLILALDEWEKDPDRAERTRDHLAIDLGAGEGRDTRELLRRGFRVVAVDPHPDSARRIHESISGDDADRVRVVGTAIEGFASAAGQSGPFDIVNASFSLPFVHPSNFAFVWSWIRLVLAPGGYFAGQFFGPKDSWASIPGRSHFAREQVEEMLDGLFQVQFEESEKDGQDAEGNAKHWHVFHVVARKPDGEGRHVLGAAC
ncbi:MAG: class I SAM-dependent methyltransferase [Planctomycetota bacterium]